MTIYFLLLAIIILGSIIFKKNKKTYIVVICLLLSLVSGFRHFTIGNDTAVYLRTHNAIVEKGLNVADTSRLEPGYIFLDFASTKVSNEFNFFLFIMALLTNMGIAFLIIKYSKNPMMSLLLFVLFRFFFDEMNIMRQFLSISIILCGVEYIKNRKLIKYLLIILLASTIHYSALFAFPIYFLYRRSFDKKTKAILLVITAIAFVSLNSILSTVTSKIGLYSGYVDAYYDSNKLGSIISAIMSASIYIYSLIIFKKYKKKASDELEYSFFLNISFICMLLNVCSIRISILSRLIDYYEIFIIVLLPNISMLIPKVKQRQLANLAIMTIGFAYFISVAMLRPNWNRVIPYKMFIE